MLTLPALRAAAFPRHLISLFQLRNLLFEFHREPL
jgi:hypothetical protein